MSTSRVTPLSFGAILGLAFGLAVLLVWVLSGRFGIGTPDPVTVQREVPVTTIQDSPAPAFDDDLYADRENAIVRAIRRVTPAVVSISTVREPMRQQLSPADLFMGTRPGRGSQATVGLRSAERNFPVSLRPAYYSGIY